MTHNPERGCGRKKPGGFYIEGEGGPSGILARWTYALDDGGVDEQNILYWQPTPRQSVEFRPLESMAHREIYRLDDPQMPDDWENETFQDLKGRVPRYGIVDHVGEEHYSAHSFINEVREHGPSRRVSKQFAHKVGNLIQQYGAVPVFFTHSRIPAFRTTGIREIAWELINACYGSEVDWDEISFVPTWQEENWGLFAANYGGWRSGMIAFLSLVDKLDNHWGVNKGYAAFQEAKVLFDKVDYVERPFGATWINHITYCLPDDGEPDPDTDLIPGLRYLDLDKDEIVGHSTAGLLED